MGDLLPGRPAVEPPVRGASPGRARRHRSLTGLSGIVLFVCMFVPAVKGCHEPVLPLEVPPFWPPYLYGGVFAFLALWRTSPGIRVASYLVRALAALTVLGSIVLAVLAPPVGIIELIIGAGLLAIAGPSGTSESRLAITGIFVGAIGIVWFGMWEVTPDALIGVHLSLIGSVGLFGGSVEWLRELASRSAVDMPRALAIVRHRR